MTSEELFRYTCVQYFFVVLFFRSENKHYLTAFAIPTTRMDACWQFIVWHKITNFDE